MLRSYVIGDARDEAALKALNDWLASRGARLLESSCSAEGDAETFRREFMVGGERLCVSADPVAGLSLCGADERLLEAAAMVVRMRTSLGRAGCAAA